MVSSSTGLTSGIDYNSILQQLRTANSQPVKILQSKGAAIQNQDAILAGIKTLFTDFNSTLKTLSQPTSFAVKGASSSDTSTLLASANGTASLASYNVEVQQLAKSNRIASQGFKTVESSVSSVVGSFKFKIGTGDEFSVSVGPGTTLAKLLDDINNLDSGLRASIVNDGTATNPYRLVLTANDTGAQNSINITHDDTSLYAQNVEASFAASTNVFNGTATTSGTYTGAADKNFVIKIKDAGAVGAATFKVSTDGGLTFGDTVYTTSTSAQDISGGEGVSIAFADGATPVNFAAGDNFTFNAFNFQLQKAQDAIIKVDGVQISRSVNVFDNAIDGVTLTAKNVSTDSVNVAVTASAGNVLSLATDLVSKYNALINEINKETAYDTTKKTGAPLFGDGSLIQLRQSLTSTFNSNVVGLTGITSLTDIGLTLNGDNTLTLDQSKFNDALKKNPDAVQKLFTEGGSTSNSQVQFISAGSNNLIGTYTAIISQAAQRATVSGSQVLSAGLAASERLILTHNGQSLSITFNAGATLDQIVKQLNDQFADSEFNAQASDDNGVLKLTTSGYGSGETISVFSNRAANAANQLGIGTAAISNTGVDVAGTINGTAGKGDGQNLRIEGGQFEGLQLLITATAPTTSTVTISQGKASTLLRSTNSALDPTNGLFAARAKSDTDRVTDISDQIDKLNARLDAEEQAMKNRFVGLETMLTQLKSQGDSLLSQLSKLA